jgi:excisionase family DNA binding protein
MLDTEQAAKYLAISGVTLERWRNKRVGPAWCKMGAIVRYRRSALEAYLEQCTRSPRRAKTAA